MKRYYITMLIMEGWTTIAEVYGWTDAYNAYSKAKEFAEAVHTYCYLVDAETCEIVSDTDIFEEDIFEEEEKEDF